MIGKRYLGGGVYADFDGRHIMLATGTGEIGASPSNMIFLDPEMMLQLEQYAREIKEGPREESDAG